MLPISLRGTLTQKTQNHSFIPMNHINSTTLQDTIWDYYRTHRRTFSWREDISPYRVVVSEIMLQQTQTHRVEKKFDEFVATFARFEELAAAPFSEVLRLWKGLGYNRRALNLHRLATIITDEQNGQLPDNIGELEQLPGIGKATARSVYAFAFNLPCAFIETNIRTVFIHFYFRDRSDVHDKEIMPLVEDTLPKKNIRDWYYALMDYGAMLKTTIGNLNTQSIHYKKQSRFLGSDRELRGKILQELLDKQKISEEDMVQIFFSQHHRLQKIVEELLSEGLIKLHQGNYLI